MSLSNSINAYKSFQRKAWLVDHNMEVLPDLNSFFRFLTVVGGRFAWRLEVLKVGTPAAK